VINKRYWLAHDCPSCGAKDEVDCWGGARMGSTTWNHDFKCCSDACGKSFAVIHKEKIKTRAGRKFLSDLWEKLSMQQDARMSGEPYEGYQAEQQLKHRVFK